MIWKVCTVNEIKVHVEIGKNLASVLNAMVDKVYAVSSSSNYYEAVFSPIKDAIIESVKAAVKGGME